MVIWSFPLKQNQFSSLLRLSLINRQLSLSLYNNNMMADHHTDKHVNSVKNTRNKNKSKNNIRLKWTKNKTMINKQNYHLMRNKIINVVKQYNQNKKKSFDEIITKTMWWSIDVYYWCSFLLFIRNVYNIVE